MFTDKQEWLDLLREAAFSARNQPPRLRLSTCPTLIPTKGLLRRARRPDHDYLLIEGSPNETRDTTISLTGKVVISTNEPISISKNGIRVIFQGIQRITCVQLLHSSSQQRELTPHRHSFRSFGLPGQSVQVHVRLRLAWFVSRSCDQPSPLS